MLLGFIFVDQFRFQVIKSLSATSENGKMYLIGRLRIIINGLARKMIKKRTHKSLTTSGVHNLAKNYECERICQPTVVKMTNN